MYTVYEEMSFSTLKYICTKTHIFIIYLWLVQGTKINKDKLTTSKSKQGACWRDRHQRASQGEIWKVSEETERKRRVFSTQPVLQDFHTNFVHLGTCLLQFCCTHNFDFQQTFLLLIISISIRTCICMYIHTYLILHTCPKIQN